MLAVRAMSLIAKLKRLVGAEPSPVETLYAAVVAQARRAEYYVEGAVPDTLDGRFDMIVLILSLLMLRLEAESGDDPRHPAAQLSADLTDRFMTDMDGNLRQDGISDQAMPRHMGRMVAALGGRIGAYRGALNDHAAMAEALQRNLYRGEPVAQSAATFVAGAALRLARQLDTVPYARLAAGNLEPEF